MAGLTDQGFTPKTQDEIKADIEAKLRSFFGEDMQLGPGSRFGTIVDIFSSELADTWLALQADYNSRFRATASGMNLDYVGSLTNSPRRYETESSVSCYLSGPKSGVTLASGLRAQVSGGDTRQFYLNTAATLTPNNFLFICNEVPNFGDLVFSWEGSPDIVIPFNSTTGQIAAILETATSLSPGDITVIGTLNIEGSIHITFVNANPTVGVPLIGETTTLQRYTKTVKVTAGFSTANTESFTGIDSTSETIPLRSVQTVVSNDPNWRYVINYTAGTPGVSRESDAEYRQRMETELQAQGTATLGGFSEQIASIEGVVSVNVVENQTDSVDSSGRPPHSIEVFVDGGSDDVVAQEIYSYKPLGIATTSVTTAGSSSERTGAIITVNSVASTLSFSSSVKVNIYMDVTLTVDSSYPDNGDELVKENLATFINNLGLGKTLYTYKLNTAVAFVKGVTTVDIKVGKIPNPALSENIIAESFEIFTCNESLITITRG